MRKRFYHDLTASQGTLLSVYSQGRGLDICMDNHRGGEPPPLACDVPAEPRPSTDWPWQMLCIALCLSSC